MQKVVDGPWKPISLNRKGPLLTNLMFADDVVLFAHADLSQVQVIKECLMDFYGAVGQRINFNKSNMFFSANVKPNFAQVLSSKMDIPITTSPGKYLGVPSL